MGSVNKVILLGRIGRDPEWKDAGNGLCTLSLATSERYKDRDENWQEKTEWHRVICWGRLAEVARDHLQSGREIYVEGQLETRKWTDKNGADRYTTEVKAFKLVFIGGRGGQQAGGQRKGGQRGGYGSRPRDLHTQPPQQRRQQPQGQPGGYGGGYGGDVPVGLDDDDLPF